jgi:hypothetical protein
MGLALALVACGPSDLELQQTIGTRVSATSRAVQSQFTPTAITRPTPTAGPVPSPTATPGPPPLTEQQVIGLFQQRLRSMKPTDEWINPNATCFDYMTGGEYFVSGKPSVQDWYATPTGAVTWRVWGNNPDRDNVDSPGDYSIRYNFSEPDTRFPSGLWTADYSPSGC